MGDWRNQEGGSDYTDVFENMRKKPSTISNEPQPNREVAIPKAELKENVSKNRNVQARTKQLYHNNN